MDFKSKIQMVAAIASEVNDLHPLLRSVFSQFENITNVETTHGTQEKGADFVLTRLDPALGSFSHIGVVVKRGKINNDLAEVNRQIEECSLPRLIDGGRRRERLSEVWVVNTSTISSNAKEKIYDQFAKQRIEFIDGEKLTSLIDKHANYFWHQVPSALGEYLSRLTRRMEILEKEGGTVGSISSDGIYIEPDIQEIEKISGVKRRSRPARPRLVNLIEEVVKNSVSILQGDMGFGKSKIARHLVQHYSSADIYNEKKVLPVHASFRKFYEEKLTLENLIAREVGSIPAAADPGTSLLIVLDGIDEAATNGKWKDELKKLITDAKRDPRIKLLLTTRPLRVLDEDVDIYAGISRYWIRPLSVAKVVQFVERACAAVAVPKKIYDDLRRSDLFKQLPQSPIAAALLSSLIAQNQNDLPSNLTELYSKSIEYMLGRWDVQKGMTPEKEYQATERVSLQLAEYIVSNQLIYMSADEAKGMVIEWHKKRNTGVDLNHLMERVFYKSAIFTIDEEDRTLAFRHRSFGEYLYAKAVRIGSHPMPMDHAFDGYWVECYFFYVGMLGDCPDLLQDLFDRDPKDEMETWLKVLALPDYVLAGYQTEYTVVEKNLYRLFIMAAKLYRDIREGRTRTRLTELSEMHLLWLFQRIIRYSYNYEFLKPAINQTVLSIDESQIDLEDKLYAQFFAACFAAQLDDYSAFEFIIKTYPADKLPLPISIAIELETKGDKDFSKLPLVKNHEKRLRKLLLGSSADGVKGRRGASAEKSLTDLFEKPLRATNLENASGSGRVDLTKDRH